MEGREKYISEKHCVICQAQDNVVLCECKGGIASSIEYVNLPKLEVLGSHLLEGSKRTNPS